LPCRGQWGGCRSPTQPFAGLPGGPPHAKQDMRSSATLLSPALTIPHPPPCRPADGGGYGQSAWDS
jgi:hypothetical protein